MRFLIVIALILAVAAGIGWYRYYQQVSVTHRLELDLAAYRRLPDLTKDYTPAIFVRADGSDVTYKIPTQVTREGQIFVEYEDRHARMSEIAEIVPVVGDSLHPMTLADIQSGTAVRLGLETNPTNPNDVTISVIYLLQ